MKALVTGITGFIGSHVGELLIQNGDDVVGVARGDWRADAPQLLRDNTPLLSWNIENPAPSELVDRVVEFKPDVIFHFAGISIPALCGRDKPSEKALSVNVQGTLNVLQLIQQLRNSGSNTRLLFASTCHVYQQVEKETAYVKETSPIDPISAYGETKLLCEQKLLNSDLPRSSICIVRGFHHIGVRQPSGLMLTDWLEQLSPHVKKINVRSTNSYLDLIDVRDAAEAYCLLAATEHPPVFCNLGSGQVSRSGDVLKTLLEEAGSDAILIVKSEDERWNPIADISELSERGWKVKRCHQQTISEMLACRPVSTSCE